MKHDDIVDGEAMFAVEGLEQRQRDLFHAYQAAFADNSREPNLRHAAALVHAWNCFAVVMGVSRV